MELVRELGSFFELYRKENGRYEVCPKENGFVCVLKGAVSGTDGMWVYKGGEDTYIFMQKEDKLEMYHGDFWEMMLNETERRDTWDEFELN